MRWRSSLMAAGALGLLLWAGSSTAQAQDYNNRNGAPYTYGHTPQNYNYGAYGYRAPAPYAVGNVPQTTYPYYGSYYYGAYPQTGYNYGGPLLYGRFGDTGRVGFRFGWW
jgi:hypothetical protein